MANDKPQKKTDIFVSIVVPADQTAGDIAGYIQKLSDVLAASYANYETLVVDNGMQVEQMQGMVGILDKVPCVRVLRLSRRHTPDAAVFAGLEASIGDFLCVLSPVTDPPEIVAKMIARNRSGVDIVQGVSSLPIDGKSYARLGRSLFYWYNRKFLQTEIPVNATYLVSYNRRAVNALTNTNRNHRYVRHLSRHIGFKIDTLEYTPTKNPRYEKTLKTGLAEGLEIVTSLSNHPLRFVAGLGVVAAVVNLLYALYVVSVNIFRGHVAEGWTTLSLQASVMFFLLFVIMAIFAEYVGRILVESRQDPAYHIMEELVSTVAIANEARRNITQ
jgi:glycosyltransferase involved in cell wall biosynthesis